MHVPTFIMFRRGPGLNDYLGTHIGVVDKPFLPFLIQPPENFKQYRRELLRFFIGKPVIDSLFN